MWLLTFLTGTIGRWLAIAGLSAVLIAGAYVKGRLDCSSAAEARLLEAQVEVLKRTLERRDAIARVDAAQAEADRAERERLDAKIKELNDALDDPDRVCIGPDGTRRLQDLWP